MTARILYVPNEAGEWRQLAWRRSLCDLDRAKLIDGYAIFSLLHDVRSGAPTDDVMGRFAQAVADFKPDIVLMQHLGSSGIRQRHIDAFLAGGDFALGYHEGDPYAWPVHPLPIESRLLGAAADEVFVSGGGVFVSNFERAHARSVRYLQWGFDPDRFPDRGLGSEVPKTSDVVVIANKNRPRLRGLPNWRDRIRFVELLQRKLGNRVALYGRGWSGPGARGLLPFDRQPEAIRSAWISANWDHFANVPMYHSDRLPISISSGTVHATTWHPGFDEVFPPGVLRGNLFSDTPERLVLRIESYLESSTVEERSEAARAGYEHAWRHLRYDDQMVTMLNHLGASIDPLEASDAWSVSRQAPSNE